MRTRLHAFTLIELLVVISIIALLVGILLPALGAAKKSAMRVRETNKLKQIGIATFAYCSDNNDELPARIRISVWPHVMRQVNSRPPKFAYDLYASLADPYIGDGLRNEIFFSKGPFLGEYRTPESPGYRETDDPGYTTMQYHNFDRNTGTWLVDRVDFSQADADSRFSRNALWSSLTWKSSSSQFVGYELADEGKAVTGTTAVFGDGSAAWVDFADMEPYWVMDLEFWQPKER